jgi:Ca2+/Na+ antiporter
MGRTGDDIIDKGVWLIALGASLLVGMVIPVMVIWSEHVQFITVSMTILFFVITVGAFFIRQGCMREVNEAIEKTIRETDKAIRKTEEALEQEETDAL